MKKFSTLATVLLLTGLNIQGTLASQEENKISDTQKRMRDTKKVTPEEPTTKRTRIEDGGYDSLIDMLPPELHLKVFSYLCQGGHKSIQTYMASKPGQSPMFDSIRDIYTGLTENNLKYSIPSQEIIKYSLNRPAEFKFYADFLEFRVMTSGNYDKKIILDATDIRGLGKFLLTLNHIKSIGFYEPYENPHQVMSLLEALKDRELSHLTLGTYSLEDKDRNPYESYVLRSLWPIIKQMHSLHSLDLDMENATFLIPIIREITELDLPLESLTIGFINLAYIDFTGSLSDVIALLIANSSFLKRLTVHDIESDLLSLKTIITSVMRRPSFEKFTIDVRGDSNEVGLETYGKLLDLVKDNPKFDFENL